MEDFDRIRTLKEEYDAMFEEFEKLDPSLTKASMYGRTRVVHNVEDILDLLEEEVETDELDPDVAEDFREEVHEFLAEAEAPVQPPDELQPDRTVQIQEEADSLIGSDGNKLDNYIKNEQNAESKTLSQDFGDNYVDQELNAQHKTLSEEFGENFLGSSDVDSDFEVPDMGGSDTDLMPVGTKRSWYDFKRYTKGKYRDFEGTFELGDDFEDTVSESDLTDTELSFEDSVSRMEGQVRDSRVIEPPDAVPPDYDINSPVPENNPLDESDPDDPFRAEPEYDPYVRPTEEPFSWKDPSTWWRRQPKSDRQQPLLAEQEMVDMSGADRGTHNMGLGERPSVRELSPEFTPEMRAGLNDLIGKARASGLSDSAIASEMGIGLSSGGGMWISRATLKDYMIKQGKGLLAAPLMIPLTLLLNKAVDGLGDTVSLGLVTADLLATGDPLGVLVYGVGQLWDAASKSRQKVIDNDTPDKDYGSKVGYVREGDTWYPAFFNQRYKSTGLWAGDQQITLDYGHDIIWRLDGEGNFVPMIPGAKSKNFVATDDEWYGKTEFRHSGTKLSSKAFVTDQIFQGDELTHNKMLDSTRDWYFLSPEDTKKVMSGEMQLESYTDDYTQMKPAARQINDWRKALDYSQDWKYSSAVQTMGPGAAVNNYAGSRGLQRLMYEGVKYGDSGVWISDEQDYDKYISDYASHQGEEWDSGHGPHHTFGNYLFDTVLRDHVEALYRTQKEAAQEAGFDKLYQTEIGAAVEKNDPGRTIAGQGGTPWSALYLDTEKDMPVAASAEELAAQLHEIELMNDRTPLQRNYLAQKVQTRYWMQQIVGIGQATELQEWVQEGTPKKMTNQAQALYSMYTWDEDRKSGAFTPDEVIERWNTGYDYYSGKRTWDIGYAMPWQNAGESYLPTLTGALAGSSAKDYMSDYRAKAYDRLTQEAAENTTAWIERTGKLDPNLKIQGIDYLLQEGGIYELPENLTRLIEEHGQAEDQADIDKLVEGDDDLARRIRLQSMGFDPDAGRQGVDAITKTPGEYGSYGADPFGDIPTGEEYDKKDDDKDDDGGKKDDDGGKKDDDVTAAAVQAAQEAAAGHWEHLQEDTNILDELVYDPFTDKWVPTHVLPPDGNDILKEAQARLDEEKRLEAEAAARKALEEAALEAYRDKVARLAERKDRRHREYLARQEARWARWERDAERRRKFEEDQKGIRTKGDIEAQKAEWLREEADDDHARPTDAQSHVPDVAPIAHDEVDHVVGDHPLHSISAGALEVLNMWGGHGSQSVKVI